MKLAGGISRSGIKDIARITLVPVELYARFALLLSVSTRPFVRLARTARYATPAPCYRAYGINTDKLRCVRIVTGCGERQHVCTTAKSYDIRDNRGVGARGVGIRDRERKRLTRKSFASSDIPGKALESAGNLFINERRAHYRSVGNNVRRDFCESSGVVDLLRLYRSCCLQCFWSFYHLYRFYTLMKSKIELTED